MKVIITRNVHTALPLALELLQHEGLRRDSRNGPVKVAPWPVTTIYMNPCERVIFWPERDANPAFHLYEALWMLEGRRDIMPMLRYTKNFANYSDDGVTMHDAYGYRWRRHFSKQDKTPYGITGYQLDQLKVIAEALQKNKEDRRCVLQMWDAEADLGKQGKAFPCNLICTFQVNSENRLDLVVFCRSNDIIYGCYGANAVHMSFLLEYMALWVGVPVGTYTQVSINWHMYEEIHKILPKLLAITGDTARSPYELDIRHFPMTEPRHGESSNDTIKRLDESIRLLVFHADSGFTLPRLFNDDEPWVDVAYAVLKAHELWRTLAAPERFEEPLKVLAAQPQNIDWVVAMKEWICRRKAIWESKNLTFAKLYGGQNASSQQTDN